ncbi:MAG: hypothetical protein RLZZ546_2918 [Bacteroidota bacterium]|jgi:hypothetical protein
MIKYILVSLLIGYLMRKFIFYPIAPQSKNQNNTATKKDTKKNFSDKIGDYTDYEEIK